MTPSGSQTWQWKIHYPKFLKVAFPIDTPISSGFPILPRFMTPEGNRSVPLPQGASEFVSAGRLRPVSSAALPSP